MTHEVVVLSLTLAAFVAGGVWALIWGRRLRFPKGKRVVAEEGRLTIHVTSKSELPEVVVESAVKAVVASVEAWEQMREDSPYDEFVVEFLEDDDFPFDYAAAYLAYVPRGIGSGVPAPVIRMSKIEEMIETGEPVIHEMMHGLLKEYTTKGKNRDHKTVGVWQAVSKTDSVQFLARIKYLGSS